MKTQREKWLKLLSEHTFSTAVVINVYSTIQGAWGVWLTLTSVLHDLGRRFGDVPAAYLTCTLSKHFFFLARDREIAPWRSSAEERRHHMPLFSLCSCFYLYGEVCAKNSSKRSSGISAKLLRYVIEQSIDTLGWISPPLITSTHNFKYCRMLFNVSSLYSAYLQNSIISNYLKRKDLAFVNDGCCDSLLRFSSSHIF